MVNMKRLKVPQREESTAESFPFMNGMDNFEVSSSFLNVTDNTPSQEMDTDGENIDDCPKGVTMEPTPGNSVFPFQFILCVMF